MRLRLATFLTFAAGPGLATGFKFVEMPPTADMPPIEAAVWYPSEAVPPEAPNTPFGQAVAMHAPVAGTDRPLVVISHGDGGWFDGHAPLARAMADAGLIAVALNHPGNSVGDETATPSRWITERPRHLARVVDYMSSDWPDAGHVDAKRIGAFGLSAGGHTVLVAAGAEMSIDRIAAHCDATPAEFVCRTGMAVDVVDAAGSFPAPIHGLQAVVVAAPGFGFGFDPVQLAELDVAIQLWCAAEDVRVSQGTNISPLAARRKPAGAVRGASHRLGGALRFPPALQPRARTGEPARLGDGLHRRPRFRPGSLPGTFQRVGRRVPRL